MPQVSGGNAVEQFGGVDIQPADARGDFGPFLVQELRARRGPQPLRGTAIDEHADAAPHGDQPVFLEALIGLGHGQRIGALIGGEGAYRRQRIPLANPAIEDHRDDLVAQAMGGQLTKIEDIAPIVTFLATDGWWITGQTIFANGGYTTR